MAANPLMAVRNALTKVRNPKTGIDIVAEGRILDLRVSPDGKVHFSLDALRDGQDEALALLKQAIAATRKVSGISDVQALATRHRTPGETIQSQPTKAPQSGHSNPLGLKEFARQGGPTKQDRINQTKTALKDVGHVLAVCSGKGGVGKSTVALNLALAFSRQGLRTGLLDADVYGPSLPILLNLDDKPVMGDGKIQAVDVHGLKVMSIGLLVDEKKAVAWRGPMVMGAVRQLINDVNWGPLDILIIDTPPGTGDAHLTLIQSDCLDSAVIVTTPQQMAIADVRRGISLFEQTRVPILGIIQNMAWIALPDGSRHHPFGEPQPLDVAPPVIGTLPLDPELTRACDVGTPLGNDNENPAITAFEQIAKQIRQSADL